MYYSKSSGARKKKSHYTILMLLFAGFPPTFVKSSQSLRKKVEIHSFSSPLVLNEIFSMPWIFGSAAVDYFPYYRRKYKLFYIHISAQRDILNNFSVLIFQAKA